MNVLHCSCESVLSNITKHFPTFLSNSIVQSWPGLRIRMRIKKRGGAFQVSSFTIFNYLHNYQSKHLEKRGSWKAAFSSKPAKEKHLSALHSIIAILGTICLKLY